MNWEKMFEYAEVLELSPYGVNREKKRAVLEQGLRQLTLYHLNHCAQYRKMLDALGYSPEGIETLGLEEIPYIPVRMFKELELSSVNKEDVFKTLTSSGTSGQKTSKIFLDRQTAANQQKTMAKIVADFTGESRSPMIIIDCPSVTKNRALFSARGAGILGFSIFGRDILYALDDDMNLRMGAVSEYIEKYNKESILLFGFTFMIWQHFYKELEQRNTSLNISNGIMIHGGGWKKLISEKVSAKDFTEKLREVCGNIRVSSYYGMVEQTGSIYMECECGNLHASTYSDIIIRRATDFGVCKNGEDGIVEVLSMLPKSYPGHALLTEDKGVILGEDNCPCGRKGKYFRIHGRLKSAEIRGCSDTYAAKF